MKLPDSVPKKEPDAYKRCVLGLTIASVIMVGLGVVVAFAQVEVDNEYGNDTVTFTDYSGTTYEVTPSMPGRSVSIPSGWGYDSTFIVSPGGHVTRTYEVDDE